MKCAVASLQKLCRDPQWLGAQPSVLGVLHTWTRAMAYHPHAHFLVSAGGLSADGQRWLEPRNPKFLVPVHALSVIFRAKMRDALKARGLLAGVPPFWRTTKWVVHAKPAGRGEKVLEYSCGSQAVKSAVAESKFKNVRGFGERAKGQILLQEHGREVWFRNVKIRELSD